MEPIDLTIGSWEQVEGNSSQRKILRTAQIDEKLMRNKPIIWSNRGRAVILLRTPLRMKIEEMRRKKLVEYVDGVQRIEI